ncbi:response regulator transcription factor [Nocardioides sp.]|uniref:response regulator transcription factor n=1 Tax=Nocardioides sp. TaxID=35761 RepID=UPI00286D5B0C|nr:response regulator transcription factor [Nocardioides sp.]
MSTRTSRDQMHCSTTKVMVVDDHRTFTDLMLLALNDVDDLECVGAAHDGTSALMLAAEALPDVVLMDVELGDEDGLELAEQLVAARPGLRVVVLTAHAQDVSIARRAARSGACALLPKDGSLPELLHHLRTARPGGMVVQLGLLQAMVDPCRPPTMPTRHGSTKSPFTALTARENHVLALLALGHDVRRIAGELHISVHTCRGYVKSLLAKLGAHSQLEAVVIANTHGLVSGQHTQ